MTVVQSLRSLSAYPIPLSTVIEIAESTGMCHDTEMQPEIRQSREFRKAQALVYIFLSEAPNVTQNGISFSLSAEERRRLRTRGESILEDLCDDTATGATPEFGYMGEDL